MEFVEDAEFAAGAIDKEACPSRACLFEIEHGPGQCPDNQVHPQHDRSFSNVSNINSDRSEADSEVQYSIHS